MTGEDMLFRVADHSCRGSPEDASRKIIQDFRTGRMGLISLQLAPESEDDDGQLKVPLQQQLESERQKELQELFRQKQQEEQQARAAQARETAKERGLELPPVVQKGVVEKDDVGKGMFDGW